MTDVFPGVMVKLYEIHPVTYGSEERIVFIGYKYHSFVYNRTLVTTLFNDHHFLKFSIQLMITVYAGINHNFNKQCSPV